MSVYHYPEEFLLNSDEKDITDFMNNIYNLNKNYKTLNISEYVEKNIKPISQKMKNIFVKIMDNNRQSICENYSKIYHNLKNLEKDINDEDSKNHIKTYEHYYKLLKEILLDNTDSYLEEQEKTQEDDREYDNFRKTLFMDNLKKDLSKYSPNFSGIVYLIDIIVKNYVLFHQ